jgi:hypothetical protein
MFFQKLQKLFLKGLLPMMFFLIVDVGNRFRHSGSANAKCAVAFLPRKARDVIPSLNL